MKRDTTTQPEKHLWKRAITHRVIAGFIERSNFDADVQDDGKGEITVKIRYKKDSNE